MRRYHFDTMPIHPQPETFESLTSYVIRLAQANGIQARNHLHTIFFPSRSPTSIRAMADLPLTDYDDFSAVAACSETELQATTFYYLSSRFNRPTSAPMVSYFLAAGTPGVLARRLRYCPICLQDDLPYYSLTWRFLTLPGCPRHGCQFLAHCLHCGREIPFLPAPLKIGVCPACGAQLSTSHAEPLDPHQHHVARVHYRDLAFLLSPWVEGTEPLAVGPRLAQWRQIRQLTIEEIAHQIGRTPRQVRTLERPVPSGGVKFRYYLDYVDCLGLTFQEFFDTTLLPEAQRRTRPLSPEMRQQREEELVCRIQLAAETLKAQGRPLLQLAVCELVGMSLSALSDYPQAKAALSWVAQEQRRDIPQQNQRREQELVLQVEQAIGCLQAEGKRVSKRAIARRVGMSTTALSAYPRVEAILTQAILQEREQRIQEWTTQVQQAMAQLQAQNRRVSKMGVARLLGRSIGAIDHYPELKALFTQSGEGIPQPPQSSEAVSIEKVQEAINHLQAQDHPVTPAAICRLAGLQPGALQSCPQLAWAVEICHQDERIRCQQRKQAVENQVLQAIESLKSRGDLVTQKDICNLTGLPQRVFDVYPDLRVPVALERRRSEQKQRDQNQRDLLEKVEQAIEDLRSSGSPLTQPAICQRVGCSLDRLRTSPQILERLKQVIEESRAETKRRRQERGQILMDEVQAAIEQLRSLGMPVTQKAIGRMVNMNPTALKKYPHVKEILDRVAAEWRQDRQKRKSGLDNRE